MYKVRLEKFVGPLDLLLSLIEKRKLLINDFSLAKITNDYLAYIEKLEQFPLRDTANFILVASTLVLLKSRSLLPALQLSEEEKGDIRNLEARLKVYKRIKELSLHVWERYGNNIIFFHEPLRDMMPVFSPTKEISLKTIFVSIKNVVRTLPRKEEIPQFVIQKVISLEDMILKLTERMARALRMSFNELVEGSKDKSQVIVGFLAMLELIKRGIIIAKQESQEKDIMLERKTP